MLLLRAAGARARGLLPGPSGPPASLQLEARERAALAELVYELLDAHADTAQLVAERDLDERWCVHLEYLQALQRHGRAMLARMGADKAA